MIHRINVFLLSLIIAFAPVYLISTAYAATPKWVLEYIKAEQQINQKKRLKAQLVKQINESGTKKTITAVVETVPTATKVGSAMIKRIHSPAGVVGVAAVTSLLSAVGWVMDEGSKVYKKEIPSGGDFTCEGKTASTPLAACQAYVDYENSRLGYNSQHQYYEKIEGLHSQQLQPNGTYAFKFCSSWKMFEGTCQFKRLTAYGSYTDSTKVPLTAGLLGALMLGDGYTDPDPNFDNDTVNTGDWTGVEDAYKEDPSGLGNELNDSLEDKAERAKPTPDNRPAPIGSPDYDKEPANDDDNDRKWDEDGNEGKTENTEKTDPETGEKTTEGSFTLPKFCDWAFTVCEWYEDWQESDKKLHDHLDETAQHQSDEKSFWSSVRSWFDWTKQEPE